MFVAAKIIRAKIMSIDAVAREPVGGTRLTPRGIDTSVPSRRISENTGREHPVAIKTSTVAFDPAKEPESLPTLEPVSLI
jgi:hypothetical protein